MTITALIRPIHQGSPFRSGSLSSELVRADLETSPAPSSVADVLLRGAHGAWTSAG